MLRSHKSVLRSSVPLAACTLALLCTGMTAHAQKAYDAALNTLPQAQGWTFTGGNANPAPSVSGGILTQDRVTTSENQMWRRTDIPNDFGTTAPKFFIETNIKVDRSEYNGNVFGGWRAGYSMYASDTAGHTFILGIADTGFRLSSDQDNTSNALSTPFINFDTTSAFNTYRLEVVNGTGSLYANGVFETSLPVGLTYSGVSDRVLFGSGSVTTGQIETHYLDYGVASASSTPEPSALVLALAGGAPCMALLARRRRKAH